ncbi:MAG: hypothetical protein Q7T82_03360 [Armatimonadota bacterium]|nr:hypothetical protein [Armatimonadota bacterium]
MTRTASGSPRWIDAFAWIGRHELRHVAHFTAFWANQDHDHDLDWDGDYIPDLDEPTFGRGGYNPLSRYTYDDEIGYGEDPIEDTEDICMRSDSYPWDAIQLWQNTECGR